MRVKQRVKGRSNHFEYVEVPDVPRQKPDRSRFVLSPCGGCKGNVRLKTLRPDAATRALVTLNIGGVLHPKSRESMAAAAQRWGVDFREITQPLVNVGGKPHWQKTFLAEWGRREGYERVLYADADTLWREDCPDVFELVPAGHVGIVSNDQFDGTLWRPGKDNRYHPMLEKWARHLGMTCPPLHAHANSGMIVFEPAAHKELFDAWNAAGKACGWGQLTRLVDQAAFSVLAHNLLTDESRTWLPMQFNTLIYRHELIRAAGVMQSFVYHYTGHRKAKLHETEWRLSVPSKASKAVAPVRAHLTRTPSPTTLGAVDLGRLVERAAVLNLDKRHDRITGFYRDLPRPWPLAWPQVVRGIDVERCPPPDWFRHPRGQWGCLQAHRRAIEDALNDGIDSLLVFEDDALCCAGFVDRLRAFLAEVPDDWEMLFLGGAHTRGARRMLGALVEIPGYVTLAHAYILRRSALEMMYDHINRCAPERPEADHRLGSFAESASCAVYCPRQWLVMQREGYSDITLKVRPRRGLVAADATR